MNHDKAPVYSCSIPGDSLSMIALAGMIGTGLFLSSGKALAQAGPLSCVLGYVLMGTVTAAVAYASAEMSAFKPVGGGFVRHAGMWLDQSSSISIGWNFWYSMAITMPAEITAAATLLGFWAPNLNPAIPISILWVAIAIINFSPVRVYGEFEFYFALLKIALITGFIIAGLAIDLKSLPNQGQIGARYWKDPYPLFLEYISTGPTGRFLGFWSTMISAAFAYGNVQIVAIAGAETRDPRKSIPKALKRTFFRVIFFYVFSIFVISLLVPADEPRLSNSGNGTAAQSPFVIALERTGNKSIPYLSSRIIRANLLLQIFTSAFSSGNACTFLASRTLHGLALDGHAPGVFLKLNRFQIPYFAVAFSVIWGAVAFLSIDKGSFQAFVWLVALVTTAGLISWVVLCITYLRFFHALQTQGISRSQLPYRSPLQPYLTYYALVVNVSIILFSGWTSFVDGFNVSSFLSNYLNCLIYPLAYLGCKIYIRDSVIPLKDMELLAELAAVNRERGLVHYQPQQKSWYDRILNAVF
ncbi:Lysine-specific permease [Leucoagaricus sp. SymC.cos]|nr:Lysine-specific permease [Leucoagaricus sp. SymC.cos]